MANICDECGTMIGNPHDECVDGSFEENKYFHPPCFDTVMRREDAEALNE